METKNAGIDDIAIYIPNTKLSLTGTYAVEKGEEPEKYSKGLGVVQSTLPDTYEDPATMGANAALKLLEKNDIDPGDVRRIAAATESSFDRSKAISTYIAGMLEDRYADEFETGFLHTGNTEHKFACIGATQALNDTVNEAIAEWGEDDYGIVIATDEALYERGDPGEATQGAGAVAMLVRQDPRVIELGLPRGKASTDETDFLKPNQQFPNVAGKRSVKVYLNHMRNALNDFQSNGGEVNPEDIDYMAYHVPFPGMARKAAPLAFRNLARGTGKWREIVEEVGDMPRFEDFENRDEFLEAEEMYEKALANSDVVQEFAARTVEPTLDFSSKTGNWYTGSVHLARASALSDAVDHGLDEGFVLIGSYGSGAQAEVHPEFIMPGFEDVIDFDVEKQLDEAHELEWPEYERLHDFHNEEKDVDMDPLTEPSGQFVLLEERGEMGERQYEFVE